LKLPKSKVLDRDTLLTLIYARVSTSGQKIKAQVDDLVNFCESKGWSNIKVFKEKASGVHGERSAFKEVLETCRQKGVARLVVYDLSRLSRKGVADVIETINSLQKMNIELVSRNEGLSFDGQMGLVMASMLSAFANIDYELRKEKQRIGIEKAKEVNGGKCPWGGARRKRDTSNDQAIFDLRDSGLSIRKIAERLKISTTTIQKAIKANTDQVSA
jgi:DNA invertase Pin-like site-specific DNA recombinase